MILLIGELEAEVRVMTESCREPTEVDIDEANFH